MAIGTTAALIGGSLLSSGIGAAAAGKAARAQKDIGGQQIDLQREIYDKQTNLFAPYRDTGGRANDIYAFENGVGDRPEGYGGFEASPGYDWLLRQGQRGIDGSAASRGNLFSGATLQAQQQNAMGLAQQERGNWLSRIGGMAGAGQAAAAQQGAAAGQMGQGIGNALGNIGNAQAAGAIGVGNAVNQGIGNAMNGLMFQQMLKS